MILLRELDFAEDNHNRAVNMLLEDSTAHSPHSWKWLHSLMVTLHLGSHIGWEWKS